MALGALDSTGEAATATATAEAGAAEAVGEGATGRTLAEAVSQESRLRFAAAAVPANACCALNWTDNATSMEAAPTDLVSFIVPALFALIFVVGVLGNGTLVFIFARHRQLRNAPNTYILSLALGDLLLIITCVPFTSTLYTFDSWPYGLLICKLSEGVKNVSLGVSVFTLTALSAERYCAIVNPLRRHLGGQGGGRALTLLAASGIWILSTVLSLPDIINSHIMEIYIKETGDHIKVCYPFPEEMGSGYPQIVVMLKFLAYYAIPLLIIAFFYVLMARHLEESTRNMPGELQNQSSQIRTRKKVAKLVLLFVIIFILCFLPHHMFMLWFHFNPTSKEEYDDFWNVLRIVGFCLSFINSCINPIALYVVSVAFRKLFNRYLFCCCCCGRAVRTADAASCKGSRAEGASGAGAAGGAGAASGAGARSQLSLRGPTAAPPLWPPPPTPHAHSQNAG